MTIADLFTAAGDGVAAIGRIPVDNVLWVAGMLLAVGFVLGAFSVFAK
jgi:hypothetical protein